MAHTATARAAVYGRESHDHTKSIDDQVAIGAEVVDEHGWTLAGSYDDGSSASRYATRPRPGWDRLLADLETGTFDVLVLWETTRGDRTLASWATLLDRCRDRGVRIHVVSDERTYDPRRARDYRDLATAGVDGAYEADRTSDRVRRGHLTAAKSGRPAMGKPPYGYRRTYDPATGKLASQEPDPATAPIVRRIFADLAEQMPITTLARRLTAEQIPPPGRPNDQRTGRGWQPSRVREIAKNPAYIGRRVHRRQGRNGGTPTTYPGSWQPLVSEETFYAVARLLADAARTTRPVRPGRYVHLLSFLATCYRGHPLVVKQGPSYGCRAAGCVRVRKDDLEDLVLAYALGRLAKRDVWSNLRRQGEITDREVQAARDEVARLTADLEDWRRSTYDGRGTTPESLAVIEAGLSEQIRRARERAEQVGVPASVRKLAGAGDALPGLWADMTIPARREVIRYLVTITVHPCPGRNPHTPVAERVVIEWRGVRREP